MSYSEDYQIPEAIKAQLSDAFYETMWNELILVFGDKVRGVDPYLVPMVSYLSSTGGWVQALSATCNSLGLSDVWSYYDKLEWYDSDRFDGEIEVELGRRFARPTNADHIRALTDEALADFLEKLNGHNHTDVPWCDNVHPECPVDYHPVPGNGCLMCTLDWLKQDYES